MDGLRPVQPTVKPKVMQKATTKDGNDSDEEIRRMTQQNRKYMENHIKKDAPKNMKIYKKTTNNAAIPPGYVCHRCNQKGHLISDCPTNGNPEFDIIRQPKGIPKNIKMEDLSEQVEDKFIKSLVNDEITYLDSELGIMDEFK